MTQSLTLFSLLLTEVKVDQRARRPSTEPAEYPRIICLLKLRNLRNFCVNGISKNVVHIFIFQQRSYLMQLLANKYYLPREQDSALKFRRETTSISIGNKLYGLNTQL